MARRVRSSGPSKTTKVLSAEEAARRAAEDERETEPGPVDPAPASERVPTALRYLPEARVPAQKTAATGAEVFAALRAAWLRLFPDAPSDESVSVLVAQWALETSWGSSCFNWNLGNVPATPGDGHAHTYYPCWEVVPRAEAAALLKAANARTDGQPGPDVVVAGETDEACALVWFYPDHPRCRFRAFATLEEGAEALLKVLFHRYRRAWSSVIIGSPGGFASDLKALDFYRAPLDGPQGYRTALVSIFNRVQAQVKKARASAA